jgi:DinB superfamily
MSARPTTDLRIALLDTFDDVWGALGTRLVGIDSEEYLWEPVAGCWSVRATSDGTAHVDGNRQDEPDPAPVTTIAWRLWHITVDCLDSYSSRLSGATGASVSGTAWHLDPAAAIADANAAWVCFRDRVAERTVEERTVEERTVEERTVEEWWRELGDQWGPFAHHSLVDLVLHALHEVTHHGAEIALLRDLYRAR